jgi:membrane AbrB-like protein
VTTLAVADHWRAGQRALLAILISAVAGGAFAVAGFPAGWLMGGSLGVAVAALLGAPVGLPHWLRNTAFVLTGVSMGTNVARDSLALLGQWPVTVAAMVVELVIVVAATGYMLQRLFGLDRGTAYLSSFPGHLSFVMGIAAAGVGDPRQITIIQVIRILMLTVCVPVGALFLPLGHFAGPTPAPPLEPLQLAVIVAACAVAGYVFTRIGIPAGYALGAMAASMTAKFTGLLDGSMPPWLLLSAYILLGALMGSRFAGITLAEFRKAALGGLIALAMIVCIVTAVAYAASRFVDMPFGQIWLGLSPGALEGMGALGIALGFDTAFIAAHHVARLLLLTVGIPLVAMMVREKRRADALNGD